MLVLKREENYASRYKMTAIVFWRHPLCYKIIDKEHGQTHYVLPSRNNYYRDRVRYFKLFSTCFGKFSGGVCGCVSSFAPLLALFP